MRIIIIITIIIISGCRQAEIIPSNPANAYSTSRQYWGIERIGPWHLRLLVGNKTKFDDPQGIACAPQYPGNKAREQSLIVQCVNSGDNCLIFSRSRYAWNVYGLETGQAQFDKPWGIAADTSGNVFVADRGKARIVQLRNESGRFNYVKDIGRPGDSLNEFTDPRGLALLPDGRILVTDAALGRVALFDAAGNPMSMWEGFLTPDGIAAVGASEKWTKYPGDEFVVVIDSLYQRVNKIDLAGNILKQARASDWGFDLAQLSGVALDFYNQILITDKYNNSLHKLDRGLNYITTFVGSAGKPVLDEPRGIAFDRRAGQLYVAERESICRLKMGVDIFDFKAEVKADSLWMDLAVGFFLTEPALCQLDVLDNSGRFLARIMENRFYPTGQNRLMWGMKLPAQLPGGKALPSLPPEFKPGQTLPKGKYTLKGIFRTTYPTREVFERVAEVGFEVK